MTPKEAKLNLEVLKRELSYNSETGEFWWRRSGKGRCMYRPVGTVTNKGYLVIMFEGERFMAHRLAWVMQKGAWPEEEIDHENRNQLDNRFVNLREATHQQNLSNTEIRVDNTSGVKGVCWDKQKGKWKVQVGPADKRVQRHFVNIDDAKAFYDEIAVELFGEFAA